MSTSKPGSAGGPPARGDLIAALARAQETAAGLNTAHMLAADQFARLAMTGVAHWCDQAADVRNPQHLLYRQLLRQWFKVQDQGRALAAGIELPAESPSTPSNGSG